ncbi:DUF4168 domain-containing protein [Mesorhizobium xinjiangense]|uniref:DUF4168 domain-containing protein n=1 Tax=Mesorhizobium xinjiangense TaxID=2678685 RepID=UPI0012EE3DBE|nr:DUF4168 domain-containing protein [Mesorhizobium xinjiangense]
MKIRTSLKILLTAACLSMSAGLATQAMAQETQAPAAQSAEFGDEKLQSFAVALVKVQSVQQEYAQKLQATGSEEEQATLQQEATGKMMEAVETTDGISVDEYNQVITAAQTDPELAQRITDFMKQPE